MIEIKVEDFNLSKYDSKVDITNFSMGNTETFMTISRYTVNIIVKYKNDKSLDGSPLLLNDGSYRLYLEEYFCCDISHNDQIIEYHLVVYDLPRDKYDNNSELLKELI